MTATIDLPSTATSTTATSTTATSSTATPPATAIPPASRFRRKALALGAIGGGVLTFLGFATTPWEGEADTAAYLGALADNPVQGQVAAVILHFGYVLIVAAILATSGLTRRRATKLGHAALILGVFGAVTLPGMVSVDFYDLALAQSLPMEQAVEISEKVQASGGAPFFILPAIVGMFLGTLLALVAGWRAGFLHWALAPIFFAGLAVTFIAPALIPALIGSGLVMVALVALGIRVWRLSDEEWESGTPAV